MTKHKFTPEEAEKAAQDRKPFETRPDNRFSNSEEARKILADYYKSPRRREDKDALLDAAFQAGSQGDEKMNDRKFGKIEFNNQRPIDIIKTAPTLAELRRAFLNDRDIRADILANKYKGEWTSTFLLNGDTIIERPDRVWQENDEWKIEGGTWSHVTIPDDGWVLNYDDKTGMPKTTGTYEEAKKIFGNDTSYFFVDKNGLRAVWRHFFRFYDNFSPFYVAALWQPANWDDALGSRSVQGSATEERIEGLEARMDARIRELESAEERLEELERRLKIERNKVDKTQNSSHVHRDIHQDGTSCSPCYTCWQEGKLAGLKEARQISILDKETLGGN